MNKFIRGGFLAGRKKYVLALVGIISAFGTYAVGDSDIFSLMQTAFTVGGVYFLCKSNENKG